MSVLYRISLRFSSTPFLLAFTIFLIDIYIKKDKKIECRFYLLSFCDDFGNGDIKIKIKKVIKEKDKKIEKN